ncbi:MAG: hypothetical protein D6E12_04035 [Desulfovibrio sp.]|nr:MAG: hypothetical protein D6E12_04035 [Desulfovibrio sp.]
MGNVISLSEYKANKLARAENPASLREIQPLLTSDLLGRDFNEFGNQVFGILKLREIFDRHLHFNEEWKHYILCLLEDAYLRQSEERQPSFRENINLLKQYILEETTQDNKRDMAGAFTILELMRHCPANEESSLPS